MDQLLSYLPYLFVGLMVFFMVKNGGCCGGHNHGHGRSREDSTQAKKES